MPERSSVPLTKSRVVELLRIHQARIEALGVRRLALFGSVVRGQARVDSDVDVLVEFDEHQKTFRNFMALSFLLEDVLEHRVELVTAESLSPFIGPHILREAVDVLRAA